jgi:polyhydroxybutyrate depolymerase
MVRFALPCPRHRRVAAAVFGIIMAVLLTVTGCNPTFASKPVAQTRTSVPHPNAYERSGRVTDPRIRLPPADFPGPYPLVVALHSLYHTGTDAEAEEGLDALAATAGFAVAYPDGTAGSWDAGSCCGQAAATHVDDVGWLRSLISDLEQRYPIDPRRVILVGLSNGGMLAYRYACEHADEIAGIAVVAASLQVSTCHPANPVEVVAIHGLLDQHVPYNGVAWSEPLQSPITSTLESLAPFRAVDRCPLPSQPADVALTGPDGQPAAIPPAASRADAGAARAPVGSAAPGAGPSATTAPATTAPAVTMPAYTAIRKQSGCLSGVSVIEYLLPEADHGWPASTGVAAFDTGEVIWRALSPARSRVAGPLY